MTEEKIHMRAEALCSSDVCTVHENAMRLEFVVASADSYAEAL